MRDVADLADVSINTASRALNNKPDVHPATRARVLEAAERLDYVANALARGLRGKRSRSLGVVAADIANPFFSEVIRGIEEAAFARGYGIIVGNTSEDPRKERRLLRTLLDQQVSGVLLTPTQKDDACLEMLSSEGIPFVLIARRFETASVHAHSVLNDDYVGAFQAVDYLIRSGCQRVLFLNGPRHIWNARQRLQGYRSAFEHRGLPVDEDMIYTAEPTMFGAYESLRKILESGVKMDAVFTFSDYMAIGASKALREAGLRIPEDVGVMGYDGIDIGAMVDPALSTVSIAKRRLGVEAVDILVQVLENEEKGALARQVTLPPEVIIRESTRPVNEPARSAKL